MESGVPSLLILSQLLSAHLSSLELFEVHLSPSELELVLALPRTCPHFSAHDIASAHLSSSQFISALLNSSQLFTSLPSSSRPFSVPLRFSEDFSIHHEPISAPQRFLAHLTSPPLISAPGLRIFNSSHLRSASRLIAILLTSSQLMPALPSSS